MVIKCQIEPTISQLSQLNVKPNEFYSFSVRKERKYVISHVTRHFLHVTFLVLGVRWHMLKVTYHLSPVTNAKSDNQVP